jgi:hypothetical protein
MWIIPLLVISAIVVAAASKSPRETVPPSRQLPPPPGSAGLPGPISVLGEILRIGQVPSPTVILCAIAEAESRGRSDLASDIVRAFVAPVVHQHQLANSRPARPAYERGSCALPSASRAQADYQRGSCALPKSPRAEAERAAPAPAAAPSSPSPSAAVPQKTQRPATQEEILAMLHTDPKVFLAMVSSGRPPVIDVPIEAQPPAASPPSMTVQPPIVVPPMPASIPSSTVKADSLAEQLRGLPGFAGAGVVRMGPSERDEVFEVQWLSGHQIPPLPQAIEGRPLLLVIADTLPDTLPDPQVQPTGLPSETVAQMQEAAGLPEAADRTRAMAPGSPLGGVPDGAWREFVMRLEREEPTFDSSRHVGQYRQRRERLAELGIDPRAIHGSAVAQRAALDSDLADAHRHAKAGGLLEHLGRSIPVPGHEGSAKITLSGMLGVIQCAGLDGAAGWLERPNDRKRYPHTTQAFLRTNGVF